MTRGEAKAYIIRHCNPDYPKGKTEWEQAINIAVDALEQPEIIRCKDCKYWCINKRLNIPWCRNLHIDRGADDFCSNAERREEGEQE